MNRTGPLIVLATTVKGKGVSFMNNSVAWHYRSPSEEELTDALIELGIKS
jgi:transketolase